MFLATGSDAIKIMKNMITYRDEENWKWGEENAGGLRRSDHLAQDLLIFPLRVGENIKKHLCPNQFVKRTLQLEAEEHAPLSENYVIS